MSAPVHHPQPVRDAAMNGLQSGDQPVPKVSVDSVAYEFPDCRSVYIPTDVRRGKLGLYESWGFPEVWVEVPDKRAPSRPNRKSGITIYLLGDDGYKQAASSAAFPSCVPSGRRARPLALRRVTPRDLRRGASRGASTRSRKCCSASSECAD